MKKSTNLLIKAIASGNVPKIQETTEGKTIAFVPIDRFEEAFNYLLEEQSRSVKVLYRPMKVEDLEPTMEALITFSKTQNFDGIPQHIVENMGECLRVLHKWNLIQTIKH